MSTKWISVKNRLPKKDASYLILMHSGDPDKPLIRIAWYNPNAGWSIVPSVWVKSIAYWMPLPKPPRECHG